MSSDYLGVDIEKPLYEYCRNATNREGDTFVGIKSEIIDDKHRLSIHFPIGYEISQNEEKVRNEIIQLLTVLQEYNDKQSVISKMSKEQLLKTVRFPVQAYMTVILYYASNGVYQIKEDNFVSGTSGPVNWNRTIKQESVIPTKKGFLYSRVRVRKHSDTDKDLITEINKYCIYESYTKLGWIYKLPEFQKPYQSKTKEVYRTYLTGIHSRTNKDKDKQLFQAMLDILDFSNTTDNPEEFYFGTNNFKYIWERIIQNVYGNVIKEYYFPRTKWKLNIGKERDNKALEPDTIMKYKKDVYVLDAKYYKYGVTKNPIHLPASSSINKQISYGEYIVTHEKFAEEINEGMRVYNAFLMPYNSLDETYKENSDKYYSIGEAVADWKISDEDHERVQGILVDVKHLMNSQILPNQKEIEKLSNKIIESLEINKGRN